MSVGVMKDQNLKLRDLHVSDTVFLSVPRGTGIFTSHIHWVDRGPGTPEDKDEVNRRDVCECDG